MLNARPEHGRLSHLLAGKGKHRNDLREWSSGVGEYRIKQKWRRDSRFQGRPAWGLEWVGSPVKDAFSLPGSLDGRNLGGGGDAAQKLTASGYNGNFIEGKHFKLAFPHACSSVSSTSTVCVFC